MRIDKLKNIPLNAQISKIEEPIVKLNFVLACYTDEQNNCFFEYSKALDGTLTSFISASTKFLENLLRPIYRTIVEDKPKVEQFVTNEPFHRPILWVSQRGHVLYIDDACREREMIFLGNTIKVFNLPKMLYVVSETSMYVYEEILDKDNNVKYIPANLPNISNITGTVCTGNSVLKIEGDWIGHLVRESYTSFWKSSFTSHSDSTGNDWTKGVYRYKRRKDAEEKSKTIKQIIELC